MWRSGQRASLREMLHLYANVAITVFAVNAGADYTRLEIEVRLARGAHFQFGGVTIGGGAATSAAGSTSTTHRPPSAASRAPAPCTTWRGTRPTRTTRPGAIAWPSTAHTPLR